jgi:hypothetical protein
VTRCEIERDGRVIFLDHLRLEADAGPIADRLDGIQAYALVVLSGPLVQTIAAGILEMVSHRPVDPSDDPVTSVAPIGRDACGGIAIRLAGANPERLTSAIKSLLGDGRVLHRFGHSGDR